MKYRITIAVDDNPGEKENYKSYNTIFEQTCEDVDMAAIIKAVNKFT